eukprot:6187731-Pleurochrysis_carterae.AAC.1
MEVGVRDSVWVYLRARNRSHTRRLGGGHTSAAVALETLVHAGACSSDVWAARTESRCRRLVPAQAEDFREALRERIFKRMNSSSEHNLTAVVRREASTRARARGKHARTREKQARAHVLEGPASSEGATLTRSAQ